MLNRTAISLLLVACTATTASAALPGREFASATEWHGTTAKREQLPQSGVSLQRLEAGQQLEVRTRARVYRLTVVDPRRGETRAAVSTDGVHFSQPAKVFFLGATRGRQPEGGQMLVLMGQIKPGLRLEIGLGSRSRFDRALTAPVTAVRLVIADAP